MGVDGAVEAGSRGCGVSRGLLGYKVAGLLGTQLPTCQVPKLKVALDSNDGDGRIVPIGLHRRELLLSNPATPATSTARPRNPETAQPRSPATA